MAEAEYPVDRARQVKVESTFPFGAMVVSDGDEGRHFEIVDIKAYRSPQGQPVLLGWALPNKDILLESPVEEREDGWVTEHDGHRVILRPLTADQGKRIKTTMEHF